MNGILLLMIEPPAQVMPLDSHQFIDYVNLTYHREVAKIMSAKPEEVLMKARGNLQRWLSAYEPGEPAARCLEEWQTLLDTKSVLELVSIITQDSDEGQRLRQSTPFVGTLSTEKRDEIRRHCTEVVLAAS